MLSGPRILKSVERCESHCCREAAVESSERYPALRGALDVRVSDMAAIAVPKGFDEGH